MLLFQPFGLRFRNYIMSAYYPETARKRAVYLYNYILQTRGTISLYIRRNIFRRAAFGLRTDRPNLRKWLLAKYFLLQPNLIFLYEISSNCRFICAIYVQYQTSSTETYTPLQRYAERMYALWLYAATYEMCDPRLYGLLLQRLLQRVKRCLLMVQHASGLCRFYCE